MSNQNFASVTTQDDKDNIFHALFGASKDGKDYCTDSAGKRKELVKYLNNYSKNMLKFSKFNPDKFLFDTIIHHIKNGFDNKDLNEFKIKNLFFK